IKHREFAMAAGEMTDAEFQSFLSTIFGHLVTHSVDGSIHYVCMDWRHCAAILTAAEAHYREFKNLCVWNKGNAGMGSFYRSKHELVFVFKNGSARHINNFGLGEGGRYRTNVWDYPGVNTLRPERRADLALHPTVKPVALVADAIRDCSKRNGLVLDPFMGSGTTLIAAERTGRVAAGIEIDPRYVDVAVRRWTALTARPAVLAGSDQTFEQVAAARSGIGSDAQPQAKD
ncbi:MAG: site-specific DNA-methyltransferase, partial [Vicinamibacterales bacterium]